MTCRCLSKQLRGAVTNCETSSHGLCLLCKDIQTTECPFSLTLLVFCEKMKCLSSLWHHFFHPPRASDCMGVIIRVSLKKAERYEQKKRKEKKNMECSTSKNKIWEAFDWHACVWANITCTQQSKRKVSLKSLAPSLSLSLSQEVSEPHHLGVNSALTSTQGTEAVRGSRVMKFFPFWPHLSTHSLTLCNENILKERRGGWWSFPITGPTLVRSDSSPVFHLHIDTPHTPFLARASCCSSSSSSLCLLYHQVKKGRLLWKLCV